jgi:hypothetical protein
MNAPEFQNIPKVLETPEQVNLKEDVENLATLRSLLVPTKPRQLPPRQPA